MTSVTPPFRFSKPASYFPPHSRITISNYQHEERDTTSNHSFADEPLVVRDVINVDIVNIRSVTASMAVQAHGRPGIFLDF